VLSFHRRVFDFDHWANLVALDTVEPVLDRVPKACRRLNHILGASETKPFEELLSLHDPRVTSSTVEGKASLETAPSVERFLVRFCLKPAFYISERLWRNDAFASALRRQTDRRFESTLHDRKGVVDPLTVKAGGAMLPNIQSVTMSAAHIA
jgi:hypothetical protein